jgi:hypothetical protein
MLVSLAEVLALEALVRVVSVLFRMVVVLVGMDVPEVLEGAGTLRVVMRHVIVLMIMRHGLMTVVMKVTV